MTGIIVGSETELVVARSVTTRAGQMWAMVGHETLVELLALAADIHGVRYTRLGRLQLMDGAILYIDGQSLEYATPPCTSWQSVALHEHDLTALITSVVAAYDETGAADLEI